MYALYRIFDENAIDKENFIKFVLLLRKEELKELHYYPFNTIDEDNGGTLKIKEIERIDPKRKRIIANDVTFSALQGAC